MKKTKWIAAALALVLALSLAACGKKNAASDLASVRAKGKLVVGITEFAPMDYKNADGTWVGFDADLAKAFAESIGVTAEFIVIDWDSKIMELNNGSIDVVWNGMTLDDGVKAAMSTSDAYCRNAQVVVVPADKADQYQTKESLSGLTFAVESGSAGEAQAKDAGWTVTPVQSQADALKEVAAGTSDACIIDLLMAGAMIGPDTSYPDLTYTDSLTQEEYGIGCRQGSDLADFITSVLAEAYQDGTTQALAQQFGIREDLLAEMPQTGYTEDAGGDVAYIRGKGTLVVGITEFAPMDYKDDNGQWTGFDAELARLVAQRLGVDVEFVIIEWGQKVNELNSKAIDVVWNGMTLTDGVQTAMTCTPAYCRNAQVIVVPAA